MRWLDALGALKWPSLLFILSPAAAYPFWLAEDAPAEACGRFTVGEQVFEAYPAASAGEIILRPMSAGAAGATRIKADVPLRFEAGGMVLDSKSFDAAGGRCSTGQGHRAQP
jgi:hypothetical protein